MQKKQAKRGVAIVWAIVMVTGIIIMATLVCDYGRVQLAKNELHRAADAAARAGASYLGDITATQAAATTYAADNTCLGDPIALDTTNDIEFGTWDKASRTFTVLTGSNRVSADSLRITCRRISARSNAVPLMFGWIIGQRTCDVNAMAVASVTPSGYGLVGLNSIKMSGNSTMSYWSATGTIAGNAGSIASNGDITSSGSSNINGTVYTLPGAKVTGVSAKTSKTLSAPLSYPDGDASPYSKTVNDNTQIAGGYVNNTPNFSIGSNKSVIIPSGNYVFNDFTVSAGSSVTFSGPVNIYYYGKFTMSGSATTKDSIPGNLKIVAIDKPDGKPPGALTISGSAALYANIYAPEADITLSGSGAIYGSIIGKTINMSGSSDIYYDLGLVPPGSSAISLVK